MMTPEHASDKAFELFSQLQSFVKQCAESSERADRVERDLFDQLLELGQSLMASFFASAGDGDVGETWNRNGKDLNRLEDVKVRQYHSIFGVIDVQRRVYAIREKKKSHAPLDSRLGLPEGKHSYVLQDFLQRFCVKNSFEDSVQSIRTLFGLRVSKLTAERLNQEFGAAIAEIRDRSRAAALADPDAQVIVASIDGKGVPMRGTVEQRRGLAETPMQKHHRKKRERKAENLSKHRPPPGHGKTHKQMAWVSAVYTIDPVPRTAASVLDGLRGSASDERPRPINKCLDAKMTDYIEGERINGQDQVFADVASQIRARNPGSRKTVICLMDGQCSLWDRQAKYLPDAIPILDLFHASEKLWDAAYCFHEQTSAEADKFIEPYFRLLLEGKVAVVLRSLRGKLRGLNGIKRKKLEAVIRYFKNNQELMKYGEYLKNGYPIAKPKPHR
jgi:hypothetical protein